MNKLLFLEKPNLKELTTQIHQLSKRADVQSILILVCDKYHLTKEELATFAPKDIPVFGAVFPQIIDNENIYENSMLILGLNNKVEATLSLNISDEENEFENNFNQHLIDEGYQTLFVFIDGYSKRISDYISTIFNTYGLELNIIGGGAGSMDTIQKPCIIFGNKLYEDAAVVCAIKSPSGIGVKHGWKPLKGPFKINESEKNTLVMLDNKSAWEIYKEVVEGDSHQKLNEENFYSIANAYPFGITTFGKEKIIRDPIKLIDNKSIQCIGDFTQNSFIHIMQAQPIDLINATSQACKEARQGIGLKTDNEVIFFIDCISRRYFLKSDYEKEIKTITQSKIETFGALTLGEIANSGKDYLEFYNKTSVVAILKDL